MGATGSSASVSLRGLKSPEPTQTQCPLGARELPLSNSPARLVSNSPARLVRRGDDLAGPAAQAR